MSSTHDDQIQVFLNGVLAFEEGGARHAYEYGPITEAARKALVVGGENVIAVHCVETGGDQQVDVGLALMSPNRE